MSSGISSTVISESESPGNKHDKWNVRLHVLDGTFAGMGIVFFHPATIMMAFFKNLTDSAILLSIAYAIPLLGHSLPPIFSAKFVEGFKRRKPFVIAVSLIQRSIMLVIALVTLYAAGKYSSAVYIILMLYGLFCFFLGITSPAWIDLCAKTIPITMRARTFAYRNLFGSALGFLVSFWLLGMLKTVPFPENFALSFFIGFIIFACTLIALALVKEDVDSPVAAKTNYKKYFKSLFAIIGKDKNFARFIHVRLISSITGCGMAFYTVYAIDQLNLEIADVAIFTSIMIASSAIMGIFLGQIGDKYGNLRILQIGAACTTSGLLLAAFFPSIEIFYVIFFLGGIAAAAQQNGSLVIVTEFGSAENRSRYIGLYSTLGGLTSGLAPILAGVAIAYSLISYSNLFLLAGGFGLLSLFLFFFYVKDPRFSK